MGVSCKLLIDVEGDQSLAIDCERLDRFSDGSRKFVALLVNQGIEAVQGGFEGSVAKILK